MNKKVALIGASVGGLLVIFLLTAFLWPGFLRSASSSAVLRYLPQDSYFVGGINFPKLEKAASIKKAIQNGFKSSRGENENFRPGNQGFVPGPQAFRELTEDSEWVLLGKTDSRSGNDYGMVVQKNKTQDANILRRKAKFASFKLPFEMLKDKSLYHSRSDNALMYLPSSRLVVVQNMAGEDFSAILDQNTGGLLPGMEERVHKLENNGIWFVMAMESDSAKMIRQQLWGRISSGKEKGKDSDENKDAKAALKNAKFITLTANPSPDGKALKAELTIQCTKEDEAKKLEDTLSSKKENLAQYISSVSPLGAVDKNVADKMTANLKDSLDFKHSGANLTITATVNEDTWDALKEFQEKRDKAEKEED